MRQLKEVKPYLLKVRLMRCLLGRARTKCAWQRIPQTSKNNDLYYDLKQANKRASTVFISCKTTLNLT